MISHGFSTEKLLGRCHEVGTACTAGRGGLSLRWFLGSTHQLMANTYCEEKLCFLSFFFFLYSKNSAGISSAWIAVFIKNDQFHSAAGLGWHSLPAHHSYCQQKGANELKQTISAVL